jgi:hypothetical protein
MTCKTVGGTRKSGLRLLAAMLVFLVGAGCESQSPQPVETVAVEPVETNWFSKEEVLSMGIYQMKDVPVAGGKMEVFEGAVVLYASIPEEENAGRGLVEVAVSADRSTKGSKLVAGSMYRMQFSELPSDFTAGSRTVVEDAVIRVLSIADPGTRAANASTPEFLQRVVITSPNQSSPLVFQIGEANNVKKLQEQYGSDARIVHVFGLGEARGQWTLEEKGPKYAV